MRQTIHQRKKGTAEEAMITMYVNDNKIVVQVLLYLVWSRCQPDIDIFKIINWS